MRVTGGRWGGRPLRSARGGVRPTSDRVRESMFARLQDLEGAAVLDLYAGTGALGLEALSRGAGSLVCVERAPRCVAALRANVESLGAGEAAEVVASDARGAMRRLGRRGARFDLVFLDPPYASDELSRALSGLREHDLLAPGAMVVIERSRRHSLPDAAGYEALDERRYGDTVITRLLAPGRNEKDMAGSGMEGGEGAREPRVALFPASFDPVTNGHLDVVHRSLRVFDELVLESR